MIVVAQVRRDILRIGLFAGLFFSRFSKPNTGATAVLVDELDAGNFKSTSDDSRVARRGLADCRLKRSIRSSSILKDGRAVFNIAGNKYRIVVWITMHIEWSTSGSLVRTVNMMQLMQRLYEGSYEYRANQIPA